MITTLTGENSFGIDQALQAIYDRFIAESSALNLQRLDGEESDYETISRALTGLSFLSAQQLVILRSPSKNKQFLDHFEDLLNNIPATTEVVIIEPALDKRTSYFKYLKKSTEFREQNVLALNDLVQWLIQQAKLRGGSLSPTDARYLIDRVGSDQMMLHSELQKLISFQPGITKKSIDLLTDPAPQSTIFQLLESAFSGNDQRTLELYTLQRAQKTEPQQVIAMLSWQLHILGLIKSAQTRSADQIAQESRLNPYVVRKSQAIARVLTLERLKDFIGRLEAIDLRSKNSALDADEALQYYLLQLSVGR